MEDMRTLLPSQILGAFVTTALVTALVLYLNLYYLVARILVAGLVGIGNYLFNAHFNFKVADSDRG